MAAGKTNIQLSVFLPQKSYLEIIQPGETPKMVATKPTPTIKIIVFKKYLGKTVSIRCDNKFLLSPNDTKIMLNIDAKVNKTKNKASICKSKSGGIFFLYIR